MSEAIATIESVRRVALEIIRDPRRSLTCGAVIAELGGGSKSTVGPLLKRVREELGQRGGGAIDPVPSHLAAEAEALIKRLHADAVEEARREYDADVARFGRIMGGLQVDLDAMTNEARAAEARAVELQVALAAAKQEVSDLERRVLIAEEAKSLIEASDRVTQSELERAREQNATLKLQIEENAAVHARLERLEQLAQPKPVNGAGAAN